MSRSSTATNVQLDGAEEIVRLSADLAELRAQLAERTNKALHHERRGENLFAALQETQEECRRLAATNQDPRKRAKACAMVRAVERRRAELAAWEARAAAGDAHAREVVEHTRDIYHGALATFYTAAVDALGLPPGTGVAIDDT